MCTESGQSPSKRARRKQNKATQARKRRKEQLSCEESEGGSTPLIEYGSDGNANIQDDGHAREHPLGSRLLRPQLGGKHEVRPSRGHAVGRTYVNIFLLAVTDHGCLAVHNRHLEEHLFRFRVLKCACVHVPTCTFQKHTSYKRTLTSRGVYLLHITLRHLCVNLKFVELQLLLLATKLLDGCQKTLWIEQFGNVHNLGNIVRIGDPIIQLLAPILKIREPTQQRPGGSEGMLGPSRRDLFHEETIGKGFHGG
mmetsp:Transcript_13283/g.36566  ORF Transcript_13283/g.36566 Transcript_13283/m.36566 type:complete len:253 (+) Transcript_13283:100-858(+)